MSFSLTTLSVRVDTSLKRQPFFPLVIIEKNRVFHYRKIFLKVKRKKSKKNLINSFFLYEYQECFVICEKNT